MGDLSKANLRNANLRSANLSRAKLGNANLTDANLRWANLNGADFQYATLIDANLAEADLREAGCFHTDLSGANLNEANLSGSFLRKANLSGAILSETIFGATQLTETLGLETCKHWGPSTIDFRTISSLSHLGHLPLTFLRGCGLSETFITYLPSLLSQPVQFYSCFISYSTADQEFADRLHADLQNKGVRCWFAPHDMKGGRKIHEQIDEAIRLYDRLLLILSERSMKSEWVKTEIAHARQKERDRRRKVLFPIGLAPFQRICEWNCFDADIGKDSAREIREYFIPDFSKWKDHDSYKGALERLLVDLKA